MEAGLRSTFSLLSFAIGSGGTLLIILLISGTVVMVVVVISAVSHRTLLITILSLLVTLTVAILTVGRLTFAGSVVIVRVIHFLIAVF